jgi:hypothetical protein
MIYLLNADRGGVDSIAGLVEQGTVKHLPCPTFVAFDKHYQNLMSANLTSADLVILDTLTRMADTTRGDMKLGVDETADYWDKRSLYLGGDKNYLTVFEAATQFLMRRLRNISARGARVTVICHEDETLDPEAMVKKWAPAVNKALYQSLVGTCTDVFRLVEIMEEETLADGKVIPVGTRKLQLHKDDYAICKYQVTPQTDGTWPNVPKFVYNPNMHKVEKVLKKRPSFMCLYGAPGAGKTSLAVSEVYPSKLKKEETKNV